ncbi:MAG TPA: hypothetical protein VFL82_03045, partial [Thermomicrobiales bacterium]|nr:hypothetical protein [Thermomicrobiales bacterium]
SAPEGIAHRNFLLAEFDHGLAIHRMVLITISLHDILSTRLTYPEMMRLMNACIAGDNGAKGENEVTRS